MNRFVLPLAVFAALLVLLAVGLTLNPREVPSPLIGKPAPQFALPLLHEPDKTFSSKDPLGKVWVFNVWASWCVGCRDEHPLLVEFAKSGAAPLYGLNYKDRREDGMKWLDPYRKPYRAWFFHAAGNTGTSYGGSGRPANYPSA